MDRRKGGLLTSEAGTVRLAPGAGPRHLAFRPDQREAYVINELDSTITRLAHDAAAGAMKAVQTVSTLPAGFKGSNSTAEVVVHPDGRLLFGSNRGHDSIAIFTIDAATGALGVAGHQPTGGKTPRNFAVDPPALTSWPRTRSDPSRGPVMRERPARARRRPVRVPRPVSLGCCVLGPAPRFANIRPPCLPLRRRGAE